MKYRRHKNARNPGRTIRRRAAVVVLPTLFTLGNCLSGFAALHYAALGPVSAPNALASNYAIAGYLIFLGMFFDLFDGFLARLTRATSNFGAELDSLADMVTFGLAPAFLTMQLITGMLSPDPGAPGTMTGAKAYFELGPAAETALGRLFWIIGALYVACAALRLARFNVFNNHDLSAHMAFRGLPTPGAAGVVASSIIFFQTIQPDARHLLHNNIPADLSSRLIDLFPYVLPLLLLTAALLMVSRFAYAHLINRFLRGRRRFNYLVYIILVLALLFWQPQITALCFIYIYALSAPLAALYRWFLRRGAPAPVVPVGSPAAPQQRSANPQPKTKPPF